MYRFYDQFTGLHLTFIPICLYIDIHIIALHERKMGRNISASFVECKHNVIMMEIILIGLRSFLDFQSMPNHNIYVIGER